MMVPSDRVQIRPGGSGDRAAVRELLQVFVDDRKILPRTSDELDELLQTSFVAISGGRVVGFAALDIYSQKLAELRRSRRVRRVSGAGRLDAVGRGLRGAGARA